MPYLFYWSQNFLGIILIFYCTQISPLLGSIRKEFLNEGDIQRCLDIMETSIRELKGRDRMAEWSSLVLDLLRQKRDKEPHNEKDILAFNLD